LLKGVEGLEGLERAIGDLEIYKRGAELVSGMINEEELG
jgi:hypothetical protein